MLPPNHAFSGALQQKGNSSTVGWLERRMASEFPAQS